MLKDIWKEFRGVKKNPTENPLNHNLRQWSINSKILYISFSKSSQRFPQKIIWKPNRGPWLIRKNKSRRIKELLENTWLKSGSIKKELVARVFTASENGVQTVKPTVKIESELAAGFNSKLKVNEFLIPDPFKIFQGWMEEVREWHFGQCCHT